MPEQEENKHHQPSINVLNHSKIGDVFIHLSPAVNGSAFFAMFLAVVFIGVYWWTNPRGFIALAASSVTTVAGFLNIVMWLTIATFGGLILNKLFLPLLHNVKALVSPPPAIHAVNDNFAVYSGNLKVHDHNQDKSIYNYKINEGQVAGVAANTPLLLPPPPVPTGRQLLLNGMVSEALAEGCIILGPDTAGTLQRMKIKRCFSTIISGLPNAGKTTTVFWIVGQLTLIGAKLWIVDPHMYFEDEEGNRSLASELNDLADSFIFPPCAGEPKQVVDRMRWMYNQLRTRQQPGYIVRADQTIIGVMDEFNSVADSIDPKLIIVEHEGHGLNFAQTLALLEREGRKYGLHFMLIGHKWARQDIGGDNAVRTNATTYMCHRLNDERQANLLIPGKSKDVLNLTVGSYWITGVTWNREPTMITTPNISAADLPLLLQMKRRGGVEVINQSNVVEGSVASFVASDTTSDTASTSYSGRDTGRDMKRPGPPVDATTDDIQLPDDLQVKMLQVLEMERTGNAGVNEIIRAVWGIEPDTRQGRAAKEELKAIRAYLAAMTLKTLNIGVN